MNFLRRASRQHSDRAVTEDDLRALRQQRRRSSIVVAQTVSSDEPLFVTPIKPAIAIFPFSTYNCQQTLIISPDPMGKDYTVMRASTAEQFLSISTPSLSIPAQSHAKQFFGRLPKYLARDEGKRKDGTNNSNNTSSDLNAVTATTNDESNAISNGDITNGQPEQTPGKSRDETRPNANIDGQLENEEAGVAEVDNGESPQECPVRKLFTLERDTLSLRRRHHITDPYSGKKLLQMEFSPSSSWNAQALKANINLLNKYSQNTTTEPVRLRWQGKRNSIEGVLEVISSLGSANGKPVAVCAKGEETAGSGDYILYVAPGMDACVAVCVVMAVDDRTRRGSGEDFGGVQGGRGLDVRPSKEDNVVWAEGYQ